MLLARFRFVSLLGVVASAALGSACAQQAAAPSESAPPAVAPAAAPAEAREGRAGRGNGGVAAVGTPQMVPDSVTEGTVTVGGQAIAYRAVAGTITVGGTDPQDATLGFDGKPLVDSGIKADAPDAPPTARMFYAAYFKKDAAAEHRPVTFIYNGGPGSSDDVAAHGDVWAEADCDAGHGAPGGGSVPDRFE